MLLVCVYIVSTTTTLHFTALLPHILLHLLLPYLYCCIYPYYYYYVYIANIYTYYYHYYRDTLQALQDDTTGECHLQLLERCKDITFVASLQGSTYTYITIYANTIYTNTLYILYTYYTYTQNTCMHALYIHSIYVHYIYRVYITVFSRCY